MGRVAVIPLLEEALQIRQALLGERHINYAEVLNNLATAYAEQGCYPEPIYWQSIL